MSFGDSSSGFGGDFCGYFGGSESRLGGRFWVLYEGGDLW